MNQVIVVKQGARRAVIAAGLRGRQGEVGEQGLPFQVDALGLLANRGAFDNEAVGFSYLATDTGELYFREGAAGGWSFGVPFQGPAGDSAYAVAVANGFVGTEVEWLAALQGDPGAEGRGITSAAIDISGHLIVTYTDATQADLGLVVGADGAAGANGADGSAGAAGRGITSMAINGSNHLIITYTDTTTEDAGLIPGAGGSGDVVGPASATNNEVALFDGITGKLLKGGGVLGTAAAASTGDFAPAAHVGAGGTAHADAVTGGAAGFMTGADKAKLDAIAAGANNYSHPNHTGDVASTGDGETVIANDAVTNAKLANMATATLKGRSTAGTGDPEDLTATQARTLLNVADGATANDTDANLKSRANHTGSQATSTITGLDAALATVKVQSIILAASDETTALTAGVAKVTFRMPYAFTVTGVRASLTTAQTSGSLLTVDINEAGTSILSTKLTLDNTEDTSVTAATAAVISDASLADNAKITIDIDQVGDGSAKGLKVTLIGYQP